MDRKDISVTLIPGFGFGVMWAMWGHHGFWWGLLYGLFWPIWMGYRFAEWLVCP